VKDVKEFEYPTKVTQTKALVGLWKTSKIGTIFHLLMAILLISGLVIDLLGVFLGGMLSPIRSVIHGYIGTVFVVVFPLYLIQVIVTKKIRMLLSAVNWINFVLYAVLILTGISIASVNQIWVDTLPWLSTALSGVRQIAPAIHAVVTYGWLLFSIIFPGGFLHGIATAYLIRIQKGKREVGD
jgi:hypothetical protein